MLCTVAATGTGGYMGLGATKAMHSFLGLSLAFYSVLQGFGVQSNESKEGEGSNVGKKVIDRGYAAIQRDVVDLGKSSALMAAGAATIVAMTTMGGAYITVQLAESYYNPADLRTLQLFGILICTVGDSIIGMALVKSIQSAGSVFLAGMSLAQAEGIKSNEARENVSASDRVSSRLGDRAVRNISADIGDVVKSLAVLGIGIGTLYVGSRMGGQSLQSAALHTWASLNPLAS